MTLSTDMTLPSGVVTFLLTDVEGSTPVWEAAPKTMALALARHDAVIATAVAAHRGTLLKARGEGDSTFSVFARATDATAAALAAQEALGAERWPEGTELRVRMAVHTGEALERDGDYYGTTVNRVARLRALALGGQILVSQSVAEVVIDHLENATFVELGALELKGLSRPERVYELVPAGAEPQGTTGVARGATTFPYKGLAAFQPEDAALFFGRGDLVDQLVARLQQRAVLVVGGPSGSGKSSLVRAGLLPALAAGALPGSEGWRVCLLTPGEQPLAALHSQLVAVEGVTGLPDVNALRARPELVSVARAAPILVAVDQFEELFMVCRDAQEREAFLAVLAALTGGAKPAGRVVLAVRADFYAECAAQPWLASAISDGHLLVGPMTRSQLRDAIEGPARSVGLQLEEGLAERVLADAAGDVGVLPLVAHALVETWLRRVGNQLTIAGYEAAGGVAGAIGRTADDVWKGLDAEQQRLARRLLPRLVHPGQGTPDTKRLLTWAELGDDPATGFVLSRFADSRLLTIDDQGVQLAHEALLRTWGTLAAWVEESRDDLRAGERVEDAAREWRRQGQHPDLLYRGLLLATSVELRARRDGGIGELAGSFLDASTVAREAEERVAAEQSRRVGRTRRRVMLVLATLTVLALVTSVAAVGALGRSRDSESSARAASQLASEQLARGLAASAVGLASGNPYLATMLAAESVARVGPPLPEAQDALVRSRLALAGDRLVPYGDPIPVGQALAVAVNPPGELAATGNADGTVTLWDVATREEFARVSGPRGGVATLAFTADGRWLVAASTDNKVWRWSLDGRTIGRGSVLADAGSVVWWVAAAPAGSTVAAATRSGNILLLDAATGAHQGKPLRGDSPNLGSVAFSPDGSSLVAATAELDGGRVFVWSLPSRKLRFPPFRAASSDVSELVVSPESATFATVSWGDGAARLWNLTTGAPMGGPFDARGMGARGVRGVTFGPGGSPVTVGGSDGALYSWSPPSRKVVERAGPVHRARVARAARSTDGLILVTQADDQTMQVWTQRPRPAPLTRLAKLAAHASSIAVAPDGDALAVGADDGTAYLLDPSTGLQRSTLTGHDGPVRAVAFDGAGRLVTGDSAGTLRAWDTSTGTVAVEHRDAHRGAVRALAIEGDELLVSGGSDGAVRFWDPRSLMAAASPPAPLQSPVTGVAIDPDGTTVAASTEHGDVGRWTTAGRPIEVVRVANDAVWAVALGGSEALAAAGGDQVLSLWSLADAQKARRTHELGSHTRGALDAVFVGAGIVATGAGDGRVRLWDAGSGQAVGPPIAVSGAPIWNLATSADGSIWAASRDGTVTRIDALVLGAACAEAGESFDVLQRARLLAGRAPLACGSSPRLPAPVDRPTTPPGPGYSGPPNACPMDGCNVRIVKAERAGTEIRLYFETNYTPDVARGHFHVFWDTYTAKQISLDATQRFGVALGNWEATGDNPYTTTGAAAVGSRGKSTTICVTSGDRNHNVVDPNLVDCRDVRSLLPGSKVNRPTKQR